MKILKGVKVFFDDEEGKEFNGIVKKIYTDTIDVEVNKEIWEIPKDAVRYKSKVKLESKLLFTVGAASNGYFVI